MISPAKFLPGGRNLWPGCREFPPVPEITKHFPAATKADARSSRRGAKIAERTSAESLRCKRSKSSRAAKIFQCGFAGRFP